MTNTRVCSAALDTVAEIWRAGLNIAVLRSPIGPDEADQDDESSDVGVIIAVTEGTGAEIDYLMGASYPYEFEHAAIVEVLTVGDDDAARRIKRDEVLLQMAALIATDPTLKATVDFAELVEPDPSIAERYAACAATLQLTYTAPTALG